MVRASDDEGTAIVYILLVIITIAMMVVGDCVAVNIQWPQLSRVQEISSVENVRGSSTGQYFHKGN